MCSVRQMVANTAPELLSEYSVDPNKIQTEALNVLQFYLKTEGCCCHAHRNRQDFHVSP
ncbi:MAG: hypothetical protein M2R45_02968 [Verrucomicrobia subdivision 3 bacterium]|nr:hypothetical protein [Limisphaerales bacterium]MCS1415312.1 hypothetical protein [Limisphaerales bacterium]